MGFPIFIAEYIAWHYGRALMELLGVGENFLWFGYHFFSINLLAKTWISPFYRIKEGYTDWTNFESLGETIVANTVSRVVGFLLRTFVIAVGIIFEILVAAGIAIAFAVWILLPIVIPALFLNGVYRII